MSHLLTEAESEPSPPEGWHNQSLMAISHGALLKYRKYLKIDTSNVHFFIIILTETENIGLLKHSLQHHHPSAPLTLVHLMHLCPSLWLL